jgi:putative FmdB family regulatory protein
MPMYEFRCRTCGDTYTEQRPMAESSAVSTCPSGHPDTVRLLTVAGALTGASRGAAAPQAGGGCCGGGCCA